MTAAQIQARVDAWLAARSDGIDRLEYFGLLARQWHAVSREFGADSSAAKGVLLGLVREAWGEDPSIDHGVIGRAVWRMRVHVRVAGHRFGNDTLAEALLSALETEP